MTIWERYGSKKIAAGFAIGMALLGAFMIWIPLADAPWWLRWVVLPVMLVYLWATPPKRLP